MALSEKIFLTKIEHVKQHIGNEMGTVTSNKLIKSDETKTYFREFSADLCGKAPIIHLHKRYE